jgi:hypothetical protein
VEGVTWPTRAHPMAKYNNIMSMLTSGSRSRLMQKWRMLALRNRENTVKILAWPEI